MTREELIKKQNLGPHPGTLSISQSTLALTWNGWQFRRTPYLPTDSGLKFVATVIASRPDRGFFYSGTLTYTRAELEQAEVFKINWPHFLQILEANLYAALKDTIDWHEGRERPEASDSAPAWVAPEDFIRPPEDK